MDINNMLLNKRILEESINFENQRKLHEEKLKIYQESCNHIAVIIMEGENVELKDRMYCECLLCEKKFPKYKSGRFIEVNNEKNRNRKDIMIDLKKKWITLLNEDIEEQQIIKLIKENIITLESKEKRISKNLNEYFGERGM